MAAVQQGEAATPANGGALQNGEIGRHRTDSILSTKSTTSTQTCDDRDPSNPEDAQVRPVAKYDFTLERVYIVLTLNQKLRLFF
jgi:hypothetical protein